jgi:hypothetical protein
MSSSTTRSTECFVLWRQVGSAGEVVMELIDEGQQLPRRSGGVLSGREPAMERCTTS